MRTKCGFFNKFHEATDFSYLPIFREMNFVIITWKNYSVWKVKNKKMYLWKDKQRVEENADMHF